jgi:hypothetical protein
MSTTKTIQSALISVFSKKVGTIVRTNSQNVLHFIIQGGTEDFIKT